MLTAFDGEKPRLAVNGFGVKSDDKFAEVVENFGSLLIACGAASMEVDIRERLQAKNPPYSSAEWCMPRSTTATL